MTNESLPGGEQIRKDTVDSPRSEAETKAKQEGGIPDAVDSEAAEHVVLLPGTGGPDDEGDVRPNVEPTD